MRNVALPIALLVAAPAFAGTPAVKETTGDLTYSYDFALPPARGRHQPSLSLSYSSASRSDSGYGYGWQMSVAYIEQETRVTPATSTRIPGPYRLVFGAKSRTLVSTGVNLFRADVETEFLSVAYTPRQDVIFSKFTATDGFGTSYEFEAVNVPGQPTWALFCNRWYLTKVTDLLGNQTVYEYELEPSVDSPQSLSDWSSSALLVGIKYNLQAPGGNQFTHSVGLEYVSDAPGSLEAVAGTMVSHRKHLSRVVVSGLGTALRSYELGYATAPLGGQRVLASVVEKGKNGALPQPATTFDYGLGALSGYSLESPVVSVPPPVSCADVNGDGLPDCRCQEWRDLDADGRADCLITSVVQGVAHYYYLRNVTPVGGATLQFMPPVELAFSETNNNSLTYDFNGDGLPDSVRQDVSSCFSGQGLVVQLGRRTATWSPTEGGFELGPAFCVDARGPFAQWKAWYPGGTCQSNGGYRVLSDVNGDGVLDYSVNEPITCTYGSATPCRWHVWLGTGSTFVESGIVPVVPGGPLSVTNLCNPPGAQAIAIDLDANGDGITEKVRIDGGTLDAQPWDAALSAGLGPGLYQAWGIGPSITVNPYYPEKVWCEYDSGGQWQVRVWDQSKFYGAIVDLNGDGRADGIFRNAIRWNSGRGFGAAQAYSVPSALWPRMSRTKIWGSYGSGCFYDVGLYGDDGSYLDLNGDGIPDYIHVDYSLSALSPTWRLYKGVLRTATGGSLDGGREILLRTVTTPLGARYQIGYASAVLFGGISARPVVASIKVQGRADGTSTLAEGATYYWYKGAASSPVWYDPARIEDRGFKESWAQDSVTRMARHTVWRTDSHAFAEMAQTTEEGIAASVSDPLVNSPPAFASVFKRITTTHAAKQVAGTTCLGAAEPAATDYPVRVVATLVRADAFPVMGVGTFSTRVDGQIACEDVDQYGNILKSTATPFVNGIAGPSLETSQTRTGTTSCLGIAQSVETRKSVAPGAGGTRGVLLTREVKSYDTSCRLQEQYAGPDTAKTNRTIFTYLGCFGQLSTSTSGGVTKALTYDAYCLNVNRATESDAAVELATDSEWDAPTGLKVSEHGPYVSMTNGSVYTGRAKTGIRRYWAYDALGRVLAVTKDPFSFDSTDPSVGNTPRALQGTKAVEAYRYDDAVKPRGVTHYRYAVETSLTNLASPAAGGDAMVTEAYFDELGRKIQERERLGSGLAASPGAQVDPNHSLTGYRVTVVTFYDGAGRLTGVLEPFYSQAAGYQDYRSAMPDARGTFTRYDDQSRPTCTWVQRANQPQLAGCTSNSAEDPQSFRLATEIRYTQEVQPNRGPYGGNFFAVETVPPDVNANGPGAAGVKKLLGAAGEELGSIDPEGNFVWVERDALGREIASWRESRDRSLATRQPASTVGYNFAGQVELTWDANAGTRTRRYDEAGRLTFVTVNGAGDGVEYAYGAGSLDRVTEVNEVVASQRKLVARNHYDTPKDEAETGYQFTAGKLASVEGSVMDGQTQSETTIVYGYDDAGRVARRDQFFRRLPSSRFGVGTSYGADGRVLRADYVNAFSAALMHTVEYDSAGRPIRMAGQLGTASPTRFWEALKSDPAYGAYDALGRIPSMEADNGLVSSVRTYGANSAMLISEHKLIKTTGDLFQTDAATYQGAKLRGFSDLYSKTRYDNLYYPSGRMQKATATPSSGTVPGPVTQDYVHGFTFNGVGNLGTASEAQDVSPESQQLNRVSQEDRSTFNYVSPAAGRVDDKLASLTVDRLRGGTPQCSTAVTYSYDGYGRLVSRTSGRPCTERGAESFGYDLQGHLISVTREVGESEKLWYGPSGELLYRQVGEEFIFYAGEYQTVRARGAPGCGVTCEPQAGTEEVDAHVLLATTRIASAKPTRTLYYYRTRLGTVVATSLDGGRPGAMYRYTPYGKVDRAVGETAETRSELGYTNALMLSGGLVYLKARVYDPESKTFLQADEVDRLRYAYVQGDPANFSDPTGLEQVDGAPPWGGNITPVMRAMGEVWAFWNNSWFLAYKIPSIIEFAKNYNAQEQANNEGEKQKQNGTALETETKTDAEASVAKGPAPANKDAKPPATTTTGPFETQPQAARNAMRSINKQSIKEDKEYIGFLFQKGDKEYVYTKAVKLGEAGGSASVPTDVDGKLVGVYHSHGGKNSAYKWENFSQTDMDTAHDLSKKVGSNVIMYLIKPDWVIRQYDPSKPQGQRVSPVPLEQKTP